MVSCPQCGQAAPDGAKFCDRCGQGLAAATPVVSLAPLEPQTELKRRYRIVELISQNSQENRYRAKRDLDGTTRTFQLRERAAPEPMTDDDTKLASEPPVSESA